MAQVISMAGWRERKSAVVQSAPELECPQCGHETAALDVAAEKMFAGLVTAHLARGGIAIAATHQPLGLEGAKELRMTGFAGAVETMW